jgi:hypothetical protein
MHGPINVKSPNNTSKWQMGFNSAFKGLIDKLSHSYMFRHYCVILSEFVVSCWSMYKIKKKNTFCVSCVYVLNDDSTIFELSPPTGKDLASTTNRSRRVPLLSLYRIPLIWGTEFWEQHNFFAFCRLLLRKIPENSYHSHSNARATNWTSGCGSVYN